MLSSTDIKKELEKKNIVIEDYNEECLRASSYLLRIGNIILEEKRNIDIIDTKNTDTKKFYQKSIIQESGFMLMPNKIYLLSSMERIRMPYNICGILNQISSLARIGLNVNGSSNLVSATFGNETASSLTFEVINLSNHKIRIYPYVKFVHISFYYHKSSSEIKYDGIYSGHNEPMPSNFQKKPSR